MMKTTIAGSRRAGGRFTGTRETHAGSRREQIVDAALEVFAEKGFRCASPRDIAVRARTNKGLITYHYPVAVNAFTWRI